MATVVITGASGFVGRHLASYLESAGHKIIPVSRRPLPGMIEVLDYSQSPDGDVLIHLAEESNRSKVNRLGETYLLSSAHVVKILSGRSYQLLIYASSGAVYGDEHECLCRVDMPVVATDVYSRSKLLNEQIVVDSGGAVVRFSNLFGDGMGTSNVLSDIICQLSGAGPLFVRDDTPIRDFLHVSDAVSAFGLLVERKFSGIMNVGSGIGTSVRTLAELLLAAVGKENRNIIAKAPSTRRSINVLDISETIRLLDWSPASYLKDQLNHLYLTKSQIILIEKRLQ